MELICKNCEQFLAFNYVCKKSSSQMFGRVLVTPLMCTYNSRITFIAQKMKFSIKDFFSKCAKNMVTFFEEIVNWKLYFFEVFLKIPQFGN